MKFICEVCPAGGAHGNNVILGDYDTWIHHLISPEHQVQQQLVLSRTSYWPVAKWFVMIKNFPNYSDATAQLYFDLMNNLSEYGFIEAIYYGNKADAILVAMHLYGTKRLPPAMKAPFGIQLDLIVTPSVKDAAKNASNAQGYLSGTFARRRFGHGEDVKTTVDACVETDLPSEVPVEAQGIMPSVEPQVNDGSDLKRSSDAAVGTKVKKCRVTYDRDILMSLNKAMRTRLPPRFEDVLKFPLQIMKLGECPPDFDAALPPPPEGMPNTPVIAPLMYAPPTQRFNRRVPSAGDAPFPTSGNPRAQDGGFGQLPLRMSGQMNASGMRPRLPREPSAVNQIPRFNRNRSVSTDNEKPSTHDDNEDPDKW